MASRRSNPPPSSRGLRLRLGSALVAMGLVGGCAEVAVPPPVPRPAVEEAQFFLPPSRGLPGGLEAGLGSSVDELHRRLLAEGASAELARLAGELARERPGEAPLEVLLAQIDLVVGDPEAAGRRLEPVVERWPSYDAAALLFGYVSERLGELPRAFESYRAIADRLPVAARRVGEIRPRALEIVSNRLDEAVAAGELDRAAEQLARLESWEPEATPALQGARRLAAARGDARAELGAVRELRRRLPEDPELRDRLATLEVAVGDPGAAISLLQEMAAERPGDPEITARLGQARFRWRVVLLPSEVRAVIRSPELTRSELAALTYWLFPSVRYARPQSARIVNDVFDHPFREEIVRVINLDLMEIDPGLHHFAPAEPVLRAEALAVILRIIAGESPQPTCVGDGLRRGRLSWPIACAAAASCGLIEAEADCLPTATLSGAEALELCRQGQELLGGE